MNRICVLALALFALVGFTLSPDVSHAQRHKAPLVDACSIHSSFCVGGVPGATYLTDNKFKGGTVSALVESSNQDYIEITIRFRGSLRWTPHEVWLCNPGTMHIGAHGPHFDDCVQMVDGFNTECGVWPNTVDSSRAGNGATYYEWIGPWKFSSTFQQKAPPSDTCNPNLVDIPCDPLDPAEPKLCGDGPYTNTMLAGCECVPNAEPLQEDPVLLFDPESFSKVVVITVPDPFGGDGHVAILANDPKVDPLFGDPVGVFCFEADHTTPCAEQ